MYLTANAITRDTYPQYRKGKEAAFNAKGQDILVLPEYSGLLNKNANEVKNILFADSADPFIEECKISQRITTFGFILVLPQLKLGINCIINLH